MLTTTFQKEKSRGMDVSNRTDIFSEMLRWVLTSLCFTGQTVEAEEVRLQVA